MLSTHPQRSTADRRAQALANADQAARDQARRDRRTRVVLGAAAALAVLTVALVVWFVLGRGGPQVEGISELPEGVDAPSVSDAHGGISFGASGEAGSTSGEDAVRVDVYVDFLCPACAQLEDVNGADLESLRSEGSATVVLHAISFLDAKSDGGSYSTRAAAAFAYVADEAPAQAYDFQVALFDSQPTEGSAALSDEQIEGIAVRVGVPADVAEGIDGERYRDFVGALTQVAFGDPDLLDDQGRFTTPTILVDGTVFEGDWSRPGELRAAVEAAAAD